MSWNKGYTTDFNYASQYIPYLSPLSILLNLTLRGIQVGQEYSIAPLEDFSYLELGFGMGVSLNIHAAVSNGFFIGTDFNPNHMLYAQNTAQASGARIELFDRDFKEFLKCLKQLNTTFDFIVLHGVWSWIGHREQRAILKIIKKYLKVGGIVYNGYNCYPGWSYKRPVGELLRFCFENTSGDVSKRIKSVLNFLETFYGMQNNPNTKDFQDIIKNLKTQSQSYIAHEYLNASWSCCYFYEMVKTMQEVKCAFGASAKILDQFDNSLENLQIPLLSRQEEFSEQLRDILLNRQFRADLFIKGKIPLLQKQGISKIENTAFILTAHPSNFSPLLTKDSQLLNNHCLEILSCLFTHKDKSLLAGEIIALCKLSFSEFNTALALLISQNLIAIKPQIVSTQTHIQAQNYNAYIFKSPLSEYNYLASAFSGCGVKVSKTHTILIQGYLQNHTTLTTLKEFNALAYPSCIVDAEEVKEFLEEYLGLYQALGFC